MHVLDGSLPLASGNAPTAERYFAVSVPGGPYEDWLAKNASGLSCQTIADFSGRPVVLVWDLGSDRDRLERLRTETLPRRKGAD
jgi:hypothetical protein